MTYQDVTLAPEDIEWVKTPVWDAARKDEVFIQFLEERGLEEAIRHFHKAHRAIADKLIDNQVVTGKEFPEAWQWIYAARIFKSARKKATHRYREIYGEDATRTLQQRLNKKYAKKLYIEDEEG